MTYDIQFEDFRLAFISLWKKKMLIIFITLVGLFVGLIYTSFISETNYYRATASVFSATYGSYELTQSEVRSLVNYSDVVSSRKVSEYAASLIKETGVTATEMQRAVSMKFGDNSYVLEITTVHSNPEIAVKMANAVSEAFVIEVSRVTGSEAIQILDSANGAYVYTFQDLNRTRLIFALAAFITIVGYVGITSLFSTKVRSIIQCVEDEAEIIGIIPIILK